MRRFAPDARCRGGGLSVDRLASGRGSRTNSNTSRQIPARVIDAAYDALPAAGFCAETRAQPLTAPLQQTCTFGKNPSLAARPAHWRNSAWESIDVLHIILQMNKLYYECADYSVVVKNRAPPPNAWRWEIYRAGNVNPIKQSSVYFDTTAAARGRAKRPSRTC